MPHTAFSIYRYAHPEDPETLAIGGLTTDLVITGGAELDRYAVVFDWLRAAARTPEDTMTWLADAVARSTTAPAGPRLPPPRERRAEDRRDA